jgi:DNA-binding response OmpR family regulator
MKRIILVEDDEPIRDVFQIIFEDSTYELIELINGEQIIQNEIEVPDLFILDKNIPGADGLDVCRLIKKSEKYNRVPVIMLSASPDIAKLANDAGADDAITKPFSLNKLREIVSHYLAG